jgi:hypothetical protein
MTKPLETEAPTDRPSWDVPRGPAMLQVQSHVCERVVRRAHMLTLQELARVAEGRVATVVSVQRSPLEHDRRELRRRRDGVTAWPLLASAAGQSICRRLSGNEE